jgi:UDP-N-acetylglucosamine--N-acetylmuramyl-(pentapeptide) pyrophosphoryl-undecaprenol N-acetylglucosamine transferase
MATPRIVIAAGGTAGHVVPALAVADALRADGAEVQFVGGDRVEASLVPEAGYRLHRLRLESLPRRSPLRAARAVVIDAAAVLSATRLLGRLDPDAVLGGGGYVAGPVGVAAALRRRPLVLVEIDGHLGLTNRLLAPLAKRVCTALPLAEHQGEKFVVTGRPVPEVKADRDGARARFGIGADETLVVVFGGSLGARSVNQAAAEAFADTDFRVLHAAGERDLPSLRSPRAGYDLRGYVPDFMDALVASDLVVGRSGGSIWEICAAGRPSILVPYPHATADHQTLNARHLADAGAAELIPDGDLTAELLKATVERLLADRGELERMGRAAAALARPHAAREIAAQALEVASWR